MSVMVSVTQARQATSADWRTLAALWRIRHRDSTEPQPKASGFV